MKFAFVTCVQIGLSCMQAIYEANKSLDLIISIPDEKSKKKSGRIYVDNFAQKHDIEVFKSNHVNDQGVIKKIREYEIDWLFIIGWSQIASKELISAPKYGTIGAHPTLLPKGRGRASIPWAIIKGLDKTGVTFFKMDDDVDTGLILGQQEVKIDKDETATSLYYKINIAHQVQIKNLISKLETGVIKGVPQDESIATYWEGRKPRHGEIKPNVMSVIEVDRLVRASTKPYPGAYINLKEKKMTIWSGFFSSTKVLDNERNEYEIKLKDGFYYAIEYTIENI